MQDDSIQRVVDWCTKANSQISPRKSALEKRTTDRLRLVPRFENGFPVARHSSCADPRQATLSGSVDPGLWRGLLGLRPLGGKP
jgi:hypothetical protein